jgi:urocanate hydratase
VQKVTAEVAAAVDWMVAARDRRQPLSVAYHGNVVDLLEYIDHQHVGVELLSDQTSCHVPYDGGYTPAGLSFERGERCWAHPGFRRLVDASLGHAGGGSCATAACTRDYGGLHEGGAHAGVPAIARNGRDVTEGFIWPSYVEDIMGPMCFDFGSARSLRLSGPEDLAGRSRGMECIIPAPRPDRDNWRWIPTPRPPPVVGPGPSTPMPGPPASPPFQPMVREGIGPVMMGRDHHDTGGTDSPFRETANISDGSMLTSDMAHQCWAGNAARGMTMTVLSNGGGVGTGKAINGGFGLVLDGSERVDRILDTALEWDAMSGVSRRAWAQRMPGTVAAGTGATHAGTSACRRWPRTLVTRAGPR